MADSLTELNAVKVTAVREGSEEGVAENDLLLRILSVGVSVSVMSDDSVGDVDLVLASTCNTFGSSSSSVTAAMAISETSRLLEVPFGCAG